MSTQAESVKQPPEPQAQVSLQPAKASVFWAPLQKLRARFRLIPSIETEIVAQLLIAMQLRVARLVVFSTVGEKNFGQIANFMGLTNDNMIRVDKNYKMLLARVEAIEKVLRMRQGDEPDDGSYVA